MGADYLVNNRLVSKVFDLSSKTPFLMYVYTLLTTLAYILDMSEKRFMEPSFCNCRK